MHLKTLLLSLVTLMSSNLFCVQTEDVLVENSPFRDKEFAQELYNELDKIHLNIKSLPNNSPKEKLQVRKAAQLSLEGVDRKYQEFVRRKQRNFKEAYIAGLIHLIEHKIIKLIVGKNAYTFMRDEGISFTVEEALNFMESNLSRFEDKTHAKLSELIKQRDHYLRVQASLSNPGKLDNLVDQTQFFKFLSLLDRQIKSANYDVSALVAMMKSLFCDDHHENEILAEIEKILGADEFVEFKALLDSLIETMQEGNDRIMNKILTPFEREQLELCQKQLLENPALMVSPEFCTVIEPIIGKFVIALSRDDIKAELTKPVSDYKHVLIQRKISRLLNEYV